jgi:hypothetical protein
MSQTQPLSISPEFANTIDTIVTQKVEEFSKLSSKQLGSRPFRPTDFNTAFTIANRVYNTTGINAAGVFLFNAANGIQVPTDSYYLIWGFQIIEDIVPLSFNSKITVNVDGVFKGEICPKIVTEQSERSVLMLDSMIEVKPDQLLEIRVFNGAGVATNAIVLPLGYRIMLKATADVT